MSRVQLPASIFLATVLFVLPLTLLHAADTPKKTLDVVHSEKGDTSDGVPGKLKITNIGKKQQYSGALKDSWDTDIFSPKSATFSPDGKRLYVNSLEGCKTVVYDAETLEKISVINYDFSNKDAFKTAPLSGFYEFTHYPGGQNRPYMGKPVESTWSHKGRYLWVPFYRRTFDLNAQDPSAIAVVDAQADSVIRIFETGPLPKMVTTSNNGNLIAITHWGDNTVGFIDITGDNPQEWHHLPPVTIGNKLKLDYPLNSAVNRDSNSGFLLRGTIFTPDDRYLLVSGMAGPLQVIDMETFTHVGSVQSLYGIRHLDIADGRIFGSQNVAATVLSLSLDSLTSAIERAKAKGSRNIVPGGTVERVKVGGGARTLSLSPDGAYAFVACNSGNAVYVVDAVKMAVVDKIRCDSYPVGLTLSVDGHRMAVTSQARDSKGGNAVNIFDIERFNSDSLFINSLNGVTKELNMTDSLKRTFADEVLRLEDSGAYQTESESTGFGWYWCLLVIPIGAVIYFVCRGKKS